MNNQRDLRDLKASKDSKIFLKGLAVLFLLVGLCLAVLALLSPSLEFDLQTLTEGPYFYQAIALQLFGLTLFITAWFVLLNFSGQPKISFLESAAHVGITLVGKYLPGKVWGLIGRVYFLKQRNYSTASSINVLLADQFLTFYTGLSIGALSLITLYNTSLSILAALVFLAVSCLIPRYYSDLMSWLVKHLHSLARRLQSVDTEDPSDSPIAYWGLLGSMIVYLVHWLAISYVLVLLFYPTLQDELFTNAILLFAAIPLAMLSGFLAVWAPGGIGVREGMIIAVLSLNLPLEVATSIAVVYRLICILNDLTTGAIAFLYYGKSGIENLKSQ